MDRNDRERMRDDEDLSGAERDRMGRQRYGETRDRYSRDADASTARGDRGYDASGDRWSGRGMDSDRGGAHNREQSARGMPQGERGYGYGQYGDDRPVTQPGDTQRGYGYGQYGDDRPTTQPSGVQRNYAYGDHGHGYDMPRGEHTGRGPKGYQRSDERIKEDVCERLTQHGQIDASDIEIEVTGGEVTLRGMVDQRQTKRMAEDVAESVSGVHEVHNQLRVGQRASGTNTAGERERSVGS